jgi:hypothetical protein
VVAAELLSKEVLSAGPPGWHGIRELDHQVRHVPAHQLVGKMGATLTDVLDAAGPLHLRLERDMEFKENDAQTVHVAAAVHLVKGTVS